MRLFTYQRLDFSITDPNVKVDVSKSGYAKSIQEYKDAHKNLSQHLGTDQIIWCYNRQDEYEYFSGEAPIEWQLEVPQNEILAYICSYVWNKLIGRECFTVSQNIRNQWVEEALAQAPNNPEKQKLIRKSLEKQFYAPEPEDRLWKRLFLDKPTAEGCSVLLQHPIKKSWVIKVVDLESKK